MTESANPIDVWKACDLVEYQPDAIVSRTLVKQHGGSLTVFAFDAGQELSEHTAPFDALVHVVDGSAEIRIEGRPYRLGAGEMIRMPAGRPHAVRGPGRFKMILTMIKDQR